MGKYQISSREDLKNLFNDLDIDVFNLGVLAYDCTGLEEMLSSFEIISLRSTKDDETIRQNSKLTVLEHIIGEQQVSEYKKNSVSLLRDSNITDHISSFTNPVLLSYKGRRQFSKFCDDFGFHNASASQKMNRKYEDKAIFRNIMRKNDIKITLSRSYPIEELPDYYELREEFGPNLVLQGNKFLTKFARSAEEFNRRMKLIRDRNETDVIVSQFISGVPVSITAIATRWGVFCSNLQYQMIGIPEILPGATTDGYFCGHDWTASNEIPNEVNPEAIRITKLFGAEMYQDEFRGFFGIDFMWDQSTNELTALECNPRLTGVTPTIDLIQNEQNRISFMSLHLLEFLAEFDLVKTSDIEVDFDKVEIDLQHDKVGTHFYISADEDKKDVKVDLQSGVYRFTGNEIEFIRQGCRIKDIQNPDNEFVVCELTDPLPTAPGGRVCRILTKRSTLDDSREGINDWTQQLVAEIYNHIHY